MGHMKDFDIRIRNGGDDAIAAVSEYVAALRITAAERQAIEVACEDLRHQEEVATLRGLLQRMDCAQSPRWIPVSERLPEEGEVVLAYLPKQIDVESGVYAAMLSKLQTLKGTFSTSFGFGFEATHWMPLPEPPEVT